jgi:uncharacterized protein YndB with AHSA1/START domain
MNQISVKTAPDAIVVEEVLPHRPQTIWKALTSGDLMARWFMPASGFAAVVGTKFTFTTTPAGAWDGTIRCEVLDVVEARRLAYSWQGGDDANVGYGSRLDTIVTWDLAAVAVGTRLRLVHSGFVLPRNETAFSNMSKGWTTIVPRLGTVIDETH